MNYFTDETGDIIISKLNEFFIEQIKLANKLTGEFRVEGEIDKTIICGAGNNRVPAEMLKEYVINSTTTENEKSRLRKKIIPPEIHVSTGFSIDRFNPSFHSVVIILSLDNKEAETMHMVRNALRSGAKIIGISASQKLLKFFKEHNIKAIDLTELYSLINRDWFNMTQRKQEVNDIDFKEYGCLFAPALLVTLLKTFSNLNLIGSVNEEVNRTVLTIEKQGYDSVGFKIAESTFNKIPLLYMQNNLNSIGKYWKNTLNTLAVVPAFTTSFSEDSYDDISTFMLPLMSDFYILTLSFDPETKEEQFIYETMKIAKEIIKHKGVSITEIRLKGQNMLTKIMSAMLLSATTALHLREQVVEENDILEPNKLSEMYSKKVMDKLKLR